MRPSVGIIGAGKVGCTLARLLAEAGYAIGAVYSRTDETARRLAQQVESVAVTDIAAMVAQADLLLVTVSDDAIESVSVELSTYDLTGKGVVHTSGVHDAHSLKAAAEMGAMIGSLHPAFPFADCEQATHNLPGATFAVEAEALQLRQWLLEIVAALQGQPLLLQAEDKALYHAALVLVSNYSVTLYAAAEKLLLDMGADRKAADEALSTLLEATAANIRQQGIPKALTGPLVRDDSGTLAAHIHALRQTDDTLAQTYLYLARLSLPLLTARDLPTAAIERLLEEI